jgi:hypothetical protein
MVQNLPIKHNATLADGQTYSVMLQASLIPHCSSYPSLNFAI